MDGRSKNRRAMGSRARNLLVAALRHWGPMYKVKRFSALERHRVGRLRSWRTALSAGGGATRSTLGIGVSRGPVSGHSMQGWSVYSRRIW